MYRHVEDIMIESNIAHRFESSRWVDVNGHEVEEGSKPQNGSRVDKT